MTPLSRAETILQELGIANPKDIDLDAIAWTLGAIVRYLPLDECDARIVGAGEKAIISVNSRNSLSRQRFSLGHELGHWIHHKNLMLFCQADKIEKPTIGAKGSEQLADRFAADILMPRYIFDGVFQKLDRPNFSVVKEVSEVFGTGLIASAIRLVETASVASVLVCHGAGGRKWFTRSVHVPEEWVPSRELRGDTSAFNVLFGKLQRSNSMRVGAQYWFQNRDAPRFEITEETFRSGNKEIVTILNFVGKPPLGS